MDGGLPEDRLSEGRMPGEDKSSERDDPAGRTPSSVAPFFTEPLSYSLSVFLGLATLVLLSFILVQLKIVLLPVVMAFFIGCLLNPLVAFFRRHHFPRGVAVTAALLLGLAALWLAFNYVMLSLTTLLEGLPGYAPKMEGLLPSLTGFLGRHFKFLTPELLTSQLSGLSFGGLFSSFFSSLLSVTGYVVLTVVLTLYFLPALDGFPAKLQRAFPAPRGEILGGAVRQISAQIQRFILYKTILCVSLGAVFTLVCHLFKVDFAGSWGVMAFLFCFIPNLGAPLAILPPFLVCQAQYGWTSALWLLAVLVAAEALFGNYVEPKFLGRSINLSPTATFLAIIAWGWLWGAVGMIIAVPLMAVVRLTFDQLPGFRPFSALMGSD
jgi:predicted PurR-regulated permease PerM